MEQGTSFSLLENGNESIFQNKRYWKNLPEAEFEKYVDKIFNHYRKKGFPHVSLLSHEKQAEFETLLSFTNKLFVGDKIKQSFHGLSLAWSYFPFWDKIKCGTYKTPYDVFSNAVALKGSIRKCLKERKVFSDAVLRSTLRIYRGAQSVSNFRPSAAREIYNAFAGEGVVYDMSCGFGGRLLGALASHRVKKYIGVDPSEKTFKGLLEIKKDFQGRKEIELHQTGSEFFSLEKASVDLCFTSPPYFNTEVYADEATQSCIAYPSQFSWIIKFLRPTLSACAQGLKENGFLIVNIANVSTFPDLEKCFLQTAARYNFELKQTLYLELSSLSKRGSFKTEPVFVLQKKKKV